MQKHAQRQFFRDIHKWIKDGCPTRNAHNFDPTVGLCMNYEAWCFVGNKQKARKPFHFNSSFPFNSNDFGHYCKETNRAKTYQNVERLAYIKKHS